MVLVVLVEDQDGKRPDAVGPLQDDQEPEPEPDAAGLLPNDGNAGTRAEDPPLVRPGVDAVGLLPG